ncbi:hypothetical protein MHI43_15750 [Paenibacillus sp. FSL H8-0457]|uniref:hypothetical protein n=1 Tax=unclassified Paenibacillus TaxID=185978 RepID=UPI0003E206EA|nr:MULTISPECIES: hypothetical protein [unclassified Paenibacillus]ETT62834.1 hypothetical protein C172_16201 [Paenibacillus sp. FSL H8-457]
MRKLWCILLLLLIVLAIIACSKPQTENLTTKKLQELYPGDIANVDSIEITDGSSGERKLFTNKKQIQAWLDQVKDMKFEPDPNQEDRSGFLYTVSLREGREIKLGFTPNSQGGHYYIHNEELSTQIQDLFENRDYIKNN